MYLREVWNGFDGAAGESNGWFPLHRLQDASLHVWGLHASDVVRIWVTTEDSPTTDDFSNADEVEISHTAGENVVAYLASVPGWVALELDTKGGSVSTRRARLTGALPG